ncbi:hypothetical protein [Enhygromyxa salina]|nr:hypothetical protein [Enhygromyxa salina]
MNTQHNLFRDLYSAIPSTVKLLVPLLIVALIGYEIFDAIRIFVHDMSQLLTLADILSGQGLNSYVHLDWSNDVRTLTVTVDRIPAKLSAVQDTIRTFAETQLHDIDAMVLCRPVANGMTCEQFL